VNTDLLVEFDEREEELRGVAKATDVTVKPGEHLSFLTLTYDSDIQSRSLASCGHASDNDSA